MRARRVSALLLSLVLWAAPGQAAAGGRPLAGLPLREALLELERRGLPVVFTSEVVGGELHVEREPEERDLRPLLDELLAAHGLTVIEGARGTLIVVRQAPPEPRVVLAGTVQSRITLAPLAGVTVRVLETGNAVTSGADGRFHIPDLPTGTYTLEAELADYLPATAAGVAVSRDGPSAVAFTLHPVPFIQDEVVVRPSQLELLEQQPSAPLALSKETIAALPHLAGDLSRALPLLPGVTANDVSATFHVHGGRSDEVQILLDGQELYEAYHLPDFDRALSVIAPSTLSSASLSTGGFAADHGDRMGGVLNLETGQALGPFRRRLALSLLTIEGSAGGSFAAETGTWLLSARRGAIDYASRLLGSEDPAFWDLFGKAAFKLSSSQELRGHLLTTDNTLEFGEVKNGDRKRFLTSYGNAALWLTHQWVLGSRALTESRASWNLLDRDRRAREDEEEQGFEIRDLRTFEVFGLAQSVSLETGGGHTLTVGAEGRHYEADYDYASTGEAAIELVSSEVEPRSGLQRFDDRLAGDHLGAYATDRFSLFDRLTLELGARYDRHTLTGETLLSPRVNAAWRLSDSSVLRAAWGHFYQSQRPYELGVEDGETHFAKAERAEHWVLGFERLVGRRERAPLTALRIELYHRDIDDPHPRSENLFEPFNNFPEAEHDRVRLLPTSSHAEGVEVLLRGALGPAIDWWVNYALAKATDQIHGREVPRQVDQRHTVNLFLSTQLGKNWNLSLAWRFHTGWPTTPIALVAEVDEEGETELEPTLGKLRSERLPSTHRLDLRAGRTWNLKRGRLAFFVDLQNVYNRKSLTGFDLEINEDEALLIKNQELSPGLLPSLGVSWEF